MAELKELKRLRDEERTLISLASLLTDQLNRLKVEELALLSKRRLQTTPANSHMTVSSRNEQELYLAEEMTAIPEQNQTSQGQEGIQIVSTTTLEDFNIEDHEQQHNSHVIDVENHVVPINLTVNKHYAGSCEEMEEEEDDDTCVITTIE